jgi:hypothetical protein
VADQSWSAANKTRHDVIVYDGRRFTGAGACIQAGRGINLPADRRYGIGTITDITTGQTGEMASPMLDLRL